MRAQTTLSARRVRRRSLGAALAVLALGAGLAAATTPAAAAPGADRAITSGHARFEVLSPTLVRTEYAGDDKFLDAATYNVIGRNAFAPAPVSTSTQHGWLRIDTGALVVRYKVGSGEFGPNNLLVTLRDGRQTVQARPWSSAGTPTCTVGALCEAESLDLDGVSVASDHRNYTGTGFAAGFQNDGNGLSFDVDVASAGSYDVAARYANNQGGDGQTTTRTLTVAVDGGAGHTLTLPPTATWDDWSVVRTSLGLTKGKHTISISRAPGDSGNVNLDSVAVLSPGAAYPSPPAPHAVPCRFGTVCEAENGLLAGSASLQTNHNDYAGKGFVGGLESTTANDKVAITGVPKAGTYDLQLRYANYLASGDTPRDRVVTVNGHPATLPPTSSWDSWRDVAIPVQLDAGDNDVTIGCPDADSCHVNLDTVAVTATGATLLAPHAALGGYRRGLDGVNGTAPTTPGLLYQDGWSLLDDTASGLVDKTLSKVTPRATHDGGYQDGYVFGYGQQYEQALHDLATLTGPSELLPRWAYGVWYSEYYDRSAADYENTILPKFRSDGVPLDVLVTDTDYKSPDRWDGWEIDKTRFPDPKAFFDWAASQGLHNSLNIHPSVLSSDPQFPAAQATAKGKLTKDNGGCYSDLGHGADCYVFDWSDPNQLKAYFDLHQQMEQQGADVWWLDWCCEQSQYSQPGVTPDAYINQQYKSDTDKLISRGFSLARAFGSLQNGGYSGPSGLPTGPWADKRSTAHFTGDTTSSWATLQNEVGFTPGESASTGLSPVSHDIGGFNNDGTQATGAEPGSTKLADDLYARWVQLGAFQPILRLHGNHSDRLPWQYGDAAKTSAEKFLNLRENLVPYTYSLAQQATATGVPVVRPTYLEYPGEQEAYANAGGEYFYGSDVLVAPVTKPGTSATTSVWFPPGAQWTDWFTGKTYQGGTTQQITSDLGTMPVFVKAGGIVPVRSNDVTNDVQNPLTQVTLNVSEGAPGSFRMYEDNGTTTNASQHATTRVTYAPDTHRVVVLPAKGSFDGQVADRSWTVAFHNASAPSTVTIDGAEAAASAWTWDATTRTLTVRAPARTPQQRLTVSYR